MPQVNPQSLEIIQPELLTGESVLWTGQPSTGVIFHKEDAMLIPFSLFWGGFAIFWEGAVSGFWRSGNPWKFGMVWGIPFVLIGQYLIWGRFVYAAWLKRRTHYAVTNRRVIAVQRNGGGRMASAYLDTLPMIVKEGRSGGVGTLRFAPSPVSQYGRGSGIWNSFAIRDTPVFLDIEDVDSVYKLTSGLREKARTVKSSS
jgi:hypothetical protein